MSDVIVNNLSGHAQCKSWAQSEPVLQNASISPEDLKVFNSNNGKRGSPSLADYYNSPDPKKRGKYEILIPEVPSSDAPRSEMVAYWLDCAILMAQISWNQGGVPIGSALIDSNGELAAMGHNNRHQWNDPTAHGEIDCMRNAGNRTDWKCCALMSTLSCCQMCSGMIVLYQIPHVVVAEDVTYQGPTQWLTDNGINVTIMTGGPQHDMCVAMMRRLQSEDLQLWNRDIGVTVCKEDSDCMVKSTYDFPKQSSCINGTCNCALAWAPREVHTKERYSSQKRKPPF